MFFVGSLTSILPYLMIAAIYLFGLAGNLVGFDVASTTTKSEVICYVDDLEKPYYSPVNTIGNHQTSHHDFIYFTDSDPPAKVGIVVSKTKQSFVTNDCIYAYLPIAHILSRPPPCFS